MHIEKIQQNTNPRVPELIMQSLIKAMEDGHIRVGEDLPSERDLAERLGVGPRLPAGVPGRSWSPGGHDGAQAARCCCGARTISRRPAPGSSAPTRWAARSSSTSSAGSSRWASWAWPASGPPREDMTALDAAVKHLDQDPSNYMYDVEFHDALAVASHNAMLASTIHLVNNLIADVRIRFWDLPSYYEQTQQSHHAIYEAVKARNAAKARQEMIRHLNIVSEFARNYPARDRGEEEAPVPEKTT